MQRFVSAIFALIDRRKKHAKIGSMQNEHNEKGGKKVLKRSQRNSPSSPRPKQSESSSTTPLPKMATLLHSISWSTPPLVVEK